jgi:transcriptional regulator with XRE-family HTH domain
MVTRGINKSLHSAEHAVFRELMIAARRKAGLTQQELAKRLKKPQSFVAKYEGGERRIDVIEFLGITAAIGADPARILKAVSGRKPARPIRR